MRIFKFGGASVKDAEGVKNIASILRTIGYEDMLMVVSAMGKTTNALEIVIQNYFGDKASLKESLDDVSEYHYAMLHELFKNKNHEVYAKVSVLFSDINSFLKVNKSPNYSYVYDQVICFGELLSTTIVSEYFNYVGITNTWIDVREFIKTDDRYQDAKVQWDQTSDRISKGIKQGTFYLTQGFLGSDANNFTTTLGREGSDYTAAIFGYCLNAQNVTIWKDVSGVLSADPRYFDEARLLNKIPYNEAIELAFYGASVMHPKTLQPLQRKQIPLYVKSFIEPYNRGTCVCDTEVLQPLLPCFIVKKNQKALFLSTRDFSFMVEDNISEVFGMLHKYNIKVDMLQNSAISFSVCIEDKSNNIKALLEELGRKFEVDCFENVSLYTVRHASDSDIRFIQENKEILLKQRFENTLQIVVQE